jgi:hypothetical protein
MNFHHFLSDLIYHLWNLIRIILDCMMKSCIIVMNLFMRYLIEMSKQYQKDEYQTTKQFWCFFRESMR